MTADDATINAVAAVIERRMEKPGDALAIARTLARAGWLKAPADEILTEADRAVLAAADAWEAAHGDGNVEGMVFVALCRQLGAVVRARRVAAGGTEEQP